MTTTEIIKGLKAVRTIHNGNYATYIDEAIKNLDVLDKVRAEIMLKDGLEEALEIIDKYKAESEE